MNMHVLRPLYGAVIALGALGFAGCGNYIACEDGACDGLGGGTVVVGDEATRDACAPATRLDHVVFDGILARFTRGAPEDEFVYFDYLAAEASPDARLALDQYLACLSYVEPARLETREERLAFWFNVYNATVIREVTGRIQTAPDFSVADASFALFKQPAYRFAGLDALSLDEIEHLIIRGDLNHDAAVGLPAERRDRLLAEHERLFATGTAVDARLHVALNCAALGCPNLAVRAPHAFTADALEFQLDRAARAFAENGAKGAGPNGLSRLFDWFEADWTRSYGSPSAFIEAHRSSGLEGVATDRYIEYDWSLNRPP